MWNSNLTNQNSDEIERVQKSFAHIALGSQYVDYRQALEALGLETLKERRIKLCRRFALKSSKHPLHSKWFVKESSSKTFNTRSIKKKYIVPFARLERFKQSPLLYLTQLLNDL